MATKAVEKAHAGLPALPQTRALDIDSSDMQLPRVKIGHFSSPAVQEGLVGAGAIYATAGSDDPAPEVLWDPKDGGDGVLFHVLDLTKGRSLWTDGELERWSANDPSAPAESWVTYDYAICLPEVDAEVPHKMLFSNTKTAAAKAINTVLLKNQARGPSYVTAFRMTTVEKENKKGKYFVPRVTVVEADNAHLEQAGQLALAVSSAPEPAPKGEVDEPGI